VAAAADIASVVVDNPAADSSGGEAPEEEVRSSRGMAAGAEVVGCNRPGSTWLQSMVLRGKKMTTVRQKWSHTGTCGERGRAGEKTKKKGEKGEKKWKGLKRSGCKK